MSYDIPFNKPFMVGKELTYMARCIVQGSSAGAGEFSMQCERLLEERFGAPHVLLTTSCTAALEMAAILCGVEEGDEVILPSYTFVSTANAFVLRGARLRFVDIRSDSLNLDERLVGDAISSATRAIVPVHYAGVACEMDALCSLASEHRIKIVEDAAQGVNALYKHRYQGTLSDYGCYSFHETKNFICGEGGALVVNDPAMVELAESVREDGTNRRSFFRGEVPAYEWHSPGSSYSLPDLLAAFLLAQLEHMDEISDRRRVICEQYTEQLAALDERGLIRLPYLPDGGRTNYHMFYVLLESEAVRRALITHLKERGILSVFHYVPLHSSPMGRQLGYAPGDLPVTEDISERLLRLPLYYDLSESDVARVSGAIGDFFGHRRN